jgi:hypothetical protein
MVSFGQEDPVKIVGESWIGGKIVVMLVIIEHASGWFCSVGLDRLIKVMTFLAGRDEIGILNYSLEDQFILLQKNLIWTS